MPRMVSSVTFTAVGSAPTVIASGSMTMSSAGMPYSSVATRRILPVRSRRSCAVAGMPVSSLASAMTAAPWRLTSGRISSIRSSSAGHRVDQRLALVGGEAGLQRLDDRSSRCRAAGRSSPAPAGSRVASSSASSVSGTPMLTSSTCAPAATCSCDVDDDLREVALAQLRREGLAPGRVDPLADDAERLVGADHDLAGLRAQDGVHGRAPRSPDQAADDAAGARGELGAGRRGAAPSGIRCSAADARQREHALHDLARDAEALAALGALGDVGGHERAEARRCARRTRRCAGSRCRPGAPRAR